MLKPPDRRIALFFPVLPPRLDGIGDYTAILAAELALKGPATILTGMDEYMQIPGVDIIPAYDPERGADHRDVLALIRGSEPDWLLVQYNPFSYGRWGLNLKLPRMLRKIRHMLPQLKIATMFHERYVPVINLKFAIMTTWQRHQFKSILKCSDLAFFSTECWTREALRYLPAKPIHHLPVISNIPRIKASSHSVRQKTGIPEDSPVIGLFGSAHASRMTHLVESAVAAAARKVPDLYVLYVGPHGKSYENLARHVSVVDTGKLPARDVSQYLSAMDVFVSPFTDGISTRRGSCMAALQHGLPTLSTSGIHTDSIFTEANGKSIILAPVNDYAGFTENLIDLLQDSGRRKEIGPAAEQFYGRFFDKSVISSQILRCMDQVEDNIT